MAFPYDQQPNFAMHPDVLDALLGVPPEDLTPVPQVPQLSGLQNFLTGFAGNEQQAYHPRNFLEGLLSGASRGLGQAGTQVQTQQAEAKQKAAQAEAQNVQSHKELRAARGKALSELSKQQAADRRAQQAYDREHNLTQIEAEAKARAKGNQAGGGGGSGFASGEGALAGLTQGGLDAAARMYSQTGQLPPMGIGKATAGIRTKIINRAAELNPNLDIAANSAGYKSDRASLANVQKIYDSSKAFSATADKNANVLLEAMKKIPDVRSPLLNKPIRSINSRLLGSADQAAFNVARQTVIPEFARLLNSPTASGQLTDQARKELEAIVRGDYSLNQMRAAIATLQKDAHNRTISYEGQLGEIKYRIKSGGQSRPPLDSFNRP